MTIDNAIQQVLKLELKALSANEIFNKIIELKLYHFKAKNPASVISTQIRRHCEGINIKESSKLKYYRKVEGNKFVLIDQ
jgi:restriction system protein